MKGRLPFILPPSSFRMCDAAADEREADSARAVEGGEVCALPFLDCAAVFEAEQARGVLRGDARRVRLREAEPVHHARGVEHRYHRARDAPALVARSTLAHAYRLAPELVVAVAEPRGRDGVADEGDALGRLAAQHEAEHESVAVDAV